MRLIAIFATLLAVAFASPNLEARQQGESCKVVHGASWAWSSVVLLPGMSGPAVYVLFIPDTIAARGDF
ncbi:hypothetical protein HAV15_008410 [Penicillium sp. str. |nr:hypothetical protein HAV15_008410 [Penicillium sp. str. \